RCVDAHPAEMLDILARAARRIVGDERATQLQLAQRPQKSGREIEELVPQIKRSVQIKRQVPDAPEFFQSGWIKARMGLHFSPSRTLLAASIAVKNGVRQNQNR